jgi:hypothetical protein
MDLFQIPAGGKRLNPSHLRCGTANADRTEITSQAPFTTEVSYPGRRRGTPERRYALRKRSQI